jgi:hypothetical protein
MTQTEVKIGYRDCKIMYEVDRMSVAQMAEKFGIEWKEMKSVLRQYGFSVRKNEPSPAEPVKTYNIVLVDTDKIVEKADPVMAV